MSSLTHHSTTRKSIEVTVPAAEVNAEFIKVLAKIAPKVKVPGFRPGKAPKDVLMKRYGREIQSEVAENLVGRHFLKAAAEAGTQPISRPALEKFDLREGAEGVFKAQYDVAPQVVLSQYLGLTLTRKKRAIDAEAVEEHLEALRQQNARFVPVEDAPAAVGHYATLDIKVKPQGMKAVNYTDQVIQLAEGRPFDQEILGMKAEESRTFSIPLPADDPNKAMAGKAVAYDVVLKDLRSREVPELTDEFAKDLGAHENLAELKATVTRELEEAADRDGTARLHSAVLDQILETTPFEVPSSMVNLQLDDYCQEFAEMAARQGVDPKNLNWSAYRQSRIQDAERAVRSGYLLQAIGNAEDIQVTDEEIDAEIRAVMEEHKITQSFDVFKGSLEQRGSTIEIKGRVRTDKIFEKIVASSTVTDEILDKEAFAALVELERRREAGIPMGRYDAGGLEGGELEDQEGGSPAAITPADHVHGPDCDHDHE